MSRIDIEVRGLFATPVAAVVLPDAEARNAEFAEIILRRRAENPASVLPIWAAGIRRATSPQWGGKRAEEVLTFARDLATKLTSDREGRSVRPEWTTEAWANVSAAGNSNSCHYHPGSFWSGTYYVADGGCADDPSLGGEFEMFDPRGPAPMMHAPSLKFGRRRRPLRPGAPRPFGHGPA